MTHEQFVSEMALIHPDIQVLGHYVNTRTKVRLKHDCGYEWDTIPYSPLNGHGCPMCSHSVMETTDIFIQKLSLVNPDIIVLGQYTGRTKKILVKSKKCGHEWMGRADGLLKGAGCPYCIGKEVLRGFNDIATTQSWMVEYFVNKEDAYTHTACSHEKVLMKCPNCGYESYKIIKSLYEQGFGCPECSDGISYPNKFMRAFIQQIPVYNIEFEYSPDWIGYKRYDGYFEYNNNKYIVEMDGEFHYTERLLDDRTLNDIKCNDKYKDEEAVKHDIFVIRIDSRKSDVEYLKNNIINSIFSDLFDLSNIDWQYCGIKATANYIKDACDYYMKNRFDISVPDMANVFHVCEATFRRYIKFGKSNNWINETDEESSLIRSLFSNFSIGKSLVVYDQYCNKIKCFNSILSCAKYMSYMYHDVFADYKINKVIIDNTNEYKGFYFYGLEGFFPTQNDMLANH